MPQAITYKVIQKTGLILYLLYALVFSRHVMGENMDRVLETSPPVVISLLERPAPARNFFTPPPPVKSNPPMAHFTHFDTEDGLAMSSVFTSFVDNIGNVWFGTHGGGISRFDGRFFTTYNTSHGLAHNSVLTILQDSQGNFWFGTFGGGISFYDGRAFVNFNKDHGLGENTVFRIIEDSKNNIWVASYGGGISRFEEGSFISYTTADGLINNTVYDIAEDISGNLWIATNGGVSKFDGNTFANYTTDDGLAHNTIRSIATDNTGNIWMGSLGVGLSVFDGEGFIHYNTSHGLADNSIWSIIQDSRGTIWFATSKGLSHFSNGKFSSLTAQEGLSHDLVRSISEDHNGNIWIGTLGGGVSRYNGPAIVTYTEKQGLTTGFVRSITQDHEGNLWMGTNGQGVMQFDGQKITTFTTRHGLAHDTVYSILSDSKQNIWLGTNGGGVSRYDGRSFTNYTSEQGLIHDRILSILEDNEGNIWLGSSLGVSRFNGNTFTNYTTEQGLPHNFIRHMLQDTRGNIWFATYGNGVSRFDGEHFENFNTSNGLAHNWVRSTLEDLQGNIWFGTYGGGISRFDGSSFSSFSTAQGLSDNVIYDMVMEEDGTIWLGTNHGFSGLFFKDPEGKIIPAGQLNANNQTLFTTYTPIWEEINSKTGFPVKNLNSNAMHILHKILPAGKDKDIGIIWGGFGDNKVIRFNPTVKFSVSKPPRVVISEIRINDELISWYTLLNSTIAMDNGRLSYPDSMIILQHEAMAFGEKLSPTERETFRKKYAYVRFDSLIPFYPIPQNLVLPYNHNDITIIFSAVETGRNFLLKYQYMIKELDNDWRNVGQRNEISLGGFWEGRYTFMVRAQNPDGIWSEPAIFSFRVLPPWWRSWWMYLTYAFLAFLIIRYLVRWRIRKLRREKWRLERTIKRRTTELRRQKEEAEKQKMLVEEKNEEINLQKEQISAQSRQLEIINQGLEERVSSEVSANREKELMLIQQSRQAAMGEMIGNIAHQWRQPLNAVAIIIQNIQDAHDYGELNSEYIHQKVSQSMEIIQYMSQTIDDFRNFFKPEKNKQDFDVKLVVEKCISFVESSLQNNKIKLTYDLPDNVFANGYSNEYAQVVMNILKNAREALLDKNVPEPLINIRLEEKEGRSYLYISDNAGGIAPEVEDKIFHPYFTTKDPGIGTGLGLYMSKTIIEKNMAGVLSFRNTQEGAEFIIRL